MKMKKLLLIVLACSVMVSSFGQKEVSTDKNVLKVNTLSLFLGTGSIFYEHGFSEKISGQLGVGYLGYKAGGTKFSGLFLTPEVRFYPKSNAIDGFYLAPYVRYQNLSLSVDADKGSMTSMGGGLAFGRQWITNSGFTMDLFFGGHYSSAKFKAETGAGEETFNLGAFKGFKPRIGFALGFAF
jgi:hypothetical protein